MDGNDQAALASPRYLVEEASVELAPNLFARNITPQVWQYQQGAYRIVRDFLEARRGRSLSSEEFDEFRALGGAVRLTIDRIALIEERIEKVVETALTAEELLGPIASKI